MATHEYSSNFAALTPLSFIKRAGQFFADKTAIVYDARRVSYAQFYERSTRLAAALSGLGLKRGDCVALMAPNIPQMLEAQFAIPMIGAVIGPLNVQLDARTIAGVLDRIDARCIIVDSEFLGAVQQALAEYDSSVPIIVISEIEEVPADLLDYECLLANHEAHVETFDVDDERQRLSLLHTSGTTGAQKTLVYTHRGAYLAAISNALSFGLEPDSVNLWTWPMFHSHGLSFVWAVTAVGATHVCMRGATPAQVFDLIAEHGVSHFCVPPTAMNALANDSSARACQNKVKCIVGGAVPPSSSMNKLESLNFETIHQYGASECYGPVTVCWRGTDWHTMTKDERYRRFIRQGTPMPLIEDFMVADLDTLEAVPRDSRTLGEIVVRGNTIMEGYYADDAATESRMGKGWFRTGDIAVWHPDGSIEIKDRAADLIVCGGRRISSVEIDEVLYDHPDVLEAAVIAVSDDDLGEVPYAFVTQKSDSKIKAKDLETHCRSALEDHKVPRQFEFADLPRTATGKIKKSELRKRLAQG